jgi:hypothetical protein
MTREEHGDYWLVVSPRIARPQQAWEWRVYKQPGVRVFLEGRAPSHDDAVLAARQWIKRQQT